MALNNPFNGSCSCERWKLTVEVDKPLEAFNPRVCDCDYCQSNPSQLISDPDMVIKLAGGEALVRKNGDGLASFYHCNHCDDLLAVGCNLGSQLRGAVNSNLLIDSNKLGKPIQIQPKRLSADEKLARWSKLWGALNGFGT